MFPGTGEKVEVYFHIAAYLLQNRNVKRVILDFEKKHTNPGTYLKPFRRSC